MPTRHQTGNYPEICRAYHFKLDILGVTEGHFTECSGLGVTIHPIPYREGGNGSIIHYFPGPVWYSPVRLSFGLTDSSTLFKWVKKSAAGEPERKNVSVIMMRNDGVTEATRWELIDAWPTKWEAAPLNAMGEMVAIASLELVYEDLKQA